MRRTLLTLALALLCSPAVFAAGGGGGGGGGSTSSTSTSSSTKANDPALVSAKAAIARNDWSAAQSQLMQALAANPGSAEYHNLYAYSIRKGPNPDMALVFREYLEALRIDARHLGAHEYIGEAYLQVNDLPKAREHLAALDRICFFGCEEYTDLKRAVAAYEAKNPR